MKKVIKFILTIVLVITSILFLNNSTITNVYAYGDFSYGARHIGEWNGTWISELYIDGQLAFCLDPSVLTPQNPADYPGYSEDWSSLSWDEQDRIARIGLAFSKGLIGYVDAQIMIWENRWFDGDIGEKKPRFDHNNFDIIIEQEERFTDTAGVIASQGYSVSNCGYGLECRIEGNDLILKGIAKADNTSATVSAQNAGGSWVAVWKKPGFQTIGVVYGSDPLGPATVNGRVRAGEIELIKKDDFGTKLSGFTFEISKDSNFSSIVDTITTNQDGYAKSKVLDNGTYYVREKTISYGYHQNTNIITVEINGNNVMLENNNGFINITKEFDLRIIKTDKNDKTVRIAGTEFEIYDVTNGERIFKTKVTTGQDIDINDPIYTESIRDNEKIWKYVAYNDNYNVTWKQAKYSRSYEVCEVKNVVGYKLDAPCQTVTMNMQDGETYKEVIFENTREEYDIKLVKRDETGKIVSDPHTFEIATDPNFKNIIDTITTNAQGEVSSKLLPALQVYYVREKETGWGYECNDQVFRIELVEKNELLDIQKTENGFVNVAIDFKITITKKDIDNPEIVLDDSKFEIYETTDGKRELITTISTGEKGTVGTYTFNEAKYKRSYEICEVKAPSGYDLDPNACKSVTMDMKEGEEARQIDFENKKNVAEANIELVKRDMQYDDIKLNGAEFTVYDITEKSNKIELYKVVSGNQYLRLYNPYNPLEALKNANIDFYAEESLTTLVASSSTDSEGVINITNVKGLEKGKEYFYKLPGQLVSFESFDVNTKIRVTKDTEVIFYNDELLTQEVARYTSDTDGWISVGDVVFKKSVEPKNTCKVNTFETASNEVVKTSAGESFKYYYKLDYVGPIQSVKVYSDVTGKSNVVLQTGKKYEICETEAPENYKINQNNKCRVISLLKEDIKDNTDLKFETERFENDINKLRLQLYKVDFDDNSILLNDGHFTIMDITWNAKDYKDILPYNSSYAVGQVVKHEDLTFVIYEAGENSFKAVNVNTRERLQIYSDRTVNIDRDNQYLTRQVTGGYIVKDFRNELEFKYDWSKLKVGDFVEGQVITEIIEKGIFKISDGTIIFKEKLDKQPQENTKFTITNEKFEFVKEVFTGKDGFAVITTIPDGLYYAYNESTGQSESFSIEMGAFNYPNLRKDMKLYVCEVQSPVGYLIGDVCEIIEVSKSDNSVVVKNIKPNKRKRRIRKMGELETNEVDIIYN